MGMLSEFTHEGVAKRLEEIILKVINSDEYTGEVKSFVKKEIYPLYIDECSEAFINSNPDIKKEFGE